MTCSDDEGDNLPQIVSTYYFEDDKEEPITFSVLPILWSETEKLSGAKEQIFLRGTVDNGLQKTHKPVIGWKFDLSNVGKPEILVLSKEKVWIKLEKPRKSYEEVCRSILITVHCLHCVRRNPDLSTKSLWDQLGRAFSSLEVKPSENDLVDHKGLISEVMRRENSIVKPEFLNKFLEEKPGRRKLPEKDIQRTRMSEFIVDYTDANGVDNDAEVDDYNEEDELFDSVCAFCDNGGELLCCEGRCLRSFHPTKDDGEDSLCVSLGLTKKQVEAMQSFFCENCKHEQHQCFVCGELGSSVKSSGAEVYCCANATCGRFYHPHCAAKWLHSKDEVAAEELARRIIAGEGFSCSIHKCCVCGLAEKKKDPEMQFAVCRRCPKSYHRKCLPREIAFEDIEDEGIVTRAWENLLLNRILIYCLDHEIYEALGTPERDHIKFPPIEEKKITVEKKIPAASELSGSTGKFGLKKMNKGFDDSLRGKSAVGKAKQSSSAVKDSQNVKKGEKIISGSGSLRKVKETGLSRKVSKESANSVSREVEPSLSNKKGPSLGEQLFALVPTVKQDTSNNDHNKTAPIKSTTTSKKFGGEVPLDADSERRISAIMEEAESSVTMDHIMKKYKHLNTLGYSTRSTVDKTITMGKVEGSVEAVRTALQKLENGSNIDDATAICDPDILDQIFRWQNKLKVYLAPFLHGMRYTSFGRHFTKPDKLEVIVDRLHWYVKDGDMIVDTSCGSNDFSVLMKAKLEETGKKCSYKNYDLFPPKNDFNYERRNWMDVQTKELPRGSQLIMGLNPPFGVRGVKGDQFIDKILEFRPKLVILIVPPEAKRLDEKKTPYELIWEDNQISAGKAFYLPGSVDENEKQIENWNVTPPPLRLWSRKDWASKHKAIAKEHAHVSGEKESGGGTSHRQLDDHGDGAYSKKPESEECCGHMKDQNDETLKKRRREEENHERGKEGKTTISKVRNETHCSLSSKTMDEKSSRASIDCVPSKSLESEKRHGSSKNQSVESTRKRKHGEENHVSGEKESGGGTSHRQLDDHGDGAYSKKPESEECCGHMKDQNDETLKKRRREEENHERGKEGKTTISKVRNETHCSLSSKTMDERSSRASIDCVPSKSLESEKRHGSSKNQSVESTRKRKHGEENHGRGTDQRSPVHGQSSKKPHESKLRNEAPRSSPLSADIKEGGSSVEFKSLARTKFEQTAPVSHKRVGKSYSETQATVDHIGRRYSLNSNEPSSAGIPRISAEANYGERYTGYRPHTAEPDYNIRAQIRQYGQHHPAASTPGNYRPSYDPGFSQTGSLSSPCGQFGSLSESTYQTNTPTMQRYAPRLDEMNPTRLGDMGSEPPTPSGYGSFYNPSRPPRPGYRDNSMGFAPGPAPAPGRRPHKYFPHNFSAGWLNE